MAAPTWAGSLEIRSDVPLAHLTTYKRGGPARWFLEVDGEASLRGLAVPAGVPIFVLGRGSNLLVADSGFNGLVLHVGQGLAGMAFEAGAVVAEGGTSLPTLARAAAVRGAAGLAFFVGIPGSVGGAIAMNAGCFGTEVADVLVSAEVHNLRTGHRTHRLASDFGFAYRHSLLEVDELVLSGRFSTHHGAESELKSEMRNITRWRKDNQPGGTRNAGSVFKNPTGGSAGRIIDELGLKGFSCGGASISEKHANFIVTSSEATAADVYALIQRVRTRVLDEIGVDLQPEIRMVGFEEDQPGG